MRRLSNILLLSVLALLPITSIDAAGPPVTSQFTTNVVDNQPVDNVQRLSTVVRDVFYYSFIQGCRGCVITHEWYLNGQPIQAYHFTLQFQVNFYWTLKPSLAPGQWTARTLINGSVVTTNTFIHDSASIRDHRESQMSEMCRKNLQYWGEVLEEYPTDDYVEFMFNKWASRCGLQ